MRLIKLQAEIIRLMEKENELLMEKEIIQRKMQLGDWLSKLKLQEVDNAITYVRQRLEKTLEKRTKLEFERTRERCL